MKHKSLFLTLLSAFLFIIQMDAEERKKYNFNSNWLLQIGDITGAEKSLGYIHLKTKPVRSNRITLRLKGSTAEQDAFGQIVELDREHSKEKKDKIKDNDRLRIIEIEFLKTLNH